VAYKLFEKVGKIKEIPNVDFLGVGCKSLTTLIV
jgi:hypothetical protein